MSKSWDTVISNAPVWVPLLVGYLVTLLLIRWGDVQALPGPLTDPSHPGFYLVGQSDSGNVRAFVALNPCLDDGATCASGLDCCCGFCPIAEGASEGTCGCEPPPCSQKNEKCEEDSDCCPPDDPATQPQNRCVGGFCNFIVPQ